MWNRTGSDRWHDKETKYERLTKRHTRNHNKLLYYKMRNIIRHPVYYVYFSGLLFDIGLSRFSAVSSVSLTLLENLRANRETEQQIKTTHIYNSNSNSQEFIITEMCAVLFLQHFSALLFHFLRADVAFWFQVFFIVHFCIVKRRRPLQLQYHIYCFIVLFSCPISFSLTLGLFLTHSCLFPPALCVFFLDHLK